MFMYANVWQIKNHLKTIAEKCEIQNNQQTDSKQSEQA